MTIKDTYENFSTALQTIYDVREANSIARIVFEDEFSIHALNSQRPFLEKNINRLEEIQSRLLEHEPVQYILGVADFYGFKFKVDTNVLIPRQETEELVYWVRNTIKTAYPNYETETLKILDIGTGSGCIPISLKKLLPELEVSALDVSEDALSIAKENANSLLHDSITFIQQDILKVKHWDKKNKYNIIISNPPYIPNEEKKLMPQRVLKHEPSLALFVPDDEPLLFYINIAYFAFDYLIPNGFLFFEINEFNSKEVVAYLEKLNFKDIILENDMNGKPRMIRAVRPTTTSISI